MVTQINGMPPVVVQAFESLNTDINEKTSTKKEERTQSNQNNSNNTDLKLKDTKNSKEETKVQKPDFSEISSKIRSLLGDENVSIEFTQDKDTKKMIMRMIDSKTKEIIKQFPPEIALKVARIVANSVNGGYVTNATI